MNNDSITQGELKELFYYDSETGYFVRIKKRQGCRVGDIAGNIHQGYRRIKINGEHYFAHRLAWLFMTGNWPDAEIDHINHDRDDNRFSNLRAATRIENSKNIKRSSNGKSVIYGVTWSESRRRWKASIGSGRNHVHLGHYPDIFFAIYIRKTAEHIYEYHENHGI